MLNEIPPWLVQQGIGFVVMTALLLALSAGRFHAPSTVAAKDQTIDLLKSLLAEQNTTLKSLSDSINRSADTNARTADLVSRLVERRERGEGS